MCLSKSLSGWTQTVLSALNSPEHKLVVTGHMVVHVLYKQMMTGLHLC